MDSILLEILVIFGILIAMLVSGVWVTASLIAVSVISLLILHGYSVDRIGAVGARVIQASVTKWELAAIPLFIFMGELMFRSDIAERIFRALRPLFGFLPGGLLHANVIGSAMFAAVTGSSSATTATVGKITLPHLKRDGYHDGIALGALAGAGTLGLLIPPSVMLIIYGVIVEVSIIDLFAAGILPGLLIAFLFSLYIAVRALLDKRVAPRLSAQTLEGYSSIQLFLDLLPVGFPMFIVLGGIYSGLVTPSEAAALGVAAVFVILLAMKQLSLQLIKKSALGAVITSCMIVTIMMSASFLSSAMALMHLPQQLATVINDLGLNPYLLIVAIAVFYIALGCLLDGISMAVMTLPFTFPIVTQAGFDPVWFGVFVVIMVEIGLLTPPIGLNLFVMQGLTRDPIGKIVKASFPFLLLLLVAVGLMVAFPQIVLVVPDLINR